MSSANDGSHGSGRVPWHEAFFGEDYLRSYAPVLPPERTAREVEGIVRLLEQLGVPPARPACCGLLREARTWT